MRRIKVLFLIHDLGPGGAEKVLVNLVNNMDSELFDITLMSLFDYGVNRQFINEGIHYKYCFKKMFRGNVTLMKLLTPKQLHKLLVRDHYDVEIAYLEGPSARVISGCPYPNTSKIAWIHIQQPKTKKPGSFRSHNEAVDCYNKFDQIHCVSEYVKDTFCLRYDIKAPIKVVYNSLETDVIRELGNQVPLEMIKENDGKIKIIGVGKLLHSKGFDRIIPMIKSLEKEGFSVHFYILGEGKDKQKLKELVRQNEVANSVTLLGYKVNPYMYIKHADLFICASLMEGFSTAASEALVLGTPVLTVDVGGMKEMLGPNNEFGIVVPNDDEHLYNALKDIVSNPEKLAYYRKQAVIRGQDFETEETVKKVEDEIMSVLNHSIL